MMIAHRRRPPVHTARNVTREIRLKKQSDFSARRPNPVLSAESHPAEKKRLVTGKRKKNTLRRVCDKLSFDLLVTRHLRSSLGILVKSEKAKVNQPISQSRRTVASDSAAPTFTLSFSKWCVPQRPADKATPLPARGEDPIADARIPPIHSLNYGIQPTRN